MNSSMCVWGEEGGGGGAVISRELCIYKQYSSYQPFIRDCDSKKNETV